MSVADNTRKFSPTCAKASNTRLYLGGLVSLLFSSGETRDNFSLFEARMQPGSEPPLHLHEERDVVFYVLEGEMDVYCGTEVSTAKTSDVVFLPHLLPHTYQVKSSTVRFLALMAPAKRIEGYFEGLSEPVSNMDLPTSATASPSQTSDLYLPWQPSMESGSSLRRKSRNMGFPAQSPGRGFEPPRGEYGTN
jgi:mannose-6-phosphate isomerase-like protein (cupin superfamily)